MLAKKNKELKNMMEDMTKESQELKGKVASMDKDLDQSIFINNNLKMELKDK